MALIKVAIFVAPGPKELIAVERICNEVGMGTCVILLNARLSTVDKFASDDARRLFMEEFEPVWNLSAAPQEAAPSCLINRSYPNDWLIARKPKVGTPKTIWTQSTKFSAEDCRQAYESIEVSDIERQGERLAENFASWLK